MHPHAELVIVEAMLQCPDRTPLEIGHEIEEQTGLEPGVSSILLYLKRNLLLLCCFITRRKLTSIPTISVHRAETLGTLNLLLVIMPLEIESVRLSLRNQLDVGYI